MKQLTALGIIMIAGIQVLMAQSDFRDGYIVKNNNDTIYGLIDYKGNNANAMKCVFKTDINSDEQIFSPDQLKAYRFTGSKYYVSRAVNSDNQTKQLFLEYLIKGIVSIYYYRIEGEGDHYLVEDANNALSELRYRQEEIFLDHTGWDRDAPYGRYIKETKDYIGQLKYIFSESPSICKRAESVGLNHNSLIKLARDYHNEVCAGEECIIYEKNLRKANITYGPVIGLNAITINETGELLDENYYFRDTQFGIDIFPSIGLYYKINMAFIDERLFFQYEATYSRFKLNTTNTFTEPVNNILYLSDVSFTQNTFSNLGIFKYELLTGRVRPSLQFGGFLRYFVKTDFKRDYQIKYTWSETYYDYHSDENPFSKFDYGINVGFGLKSIIFSGREVFLDFRYQRGFGLLTRLNTNIFSANLGFQLVK